MRKINLEKTKEAGFSNKGDGQGCQTNELSLKGKGDEARPVSYTHLTLPTSGRV